MTRYAEVAVSSTFPHRQPFSYAVPAGMEVREGHAAYVPFGRRTLQGIVLEVHDTPVFSEPEKIRPIRSLAGEEPLIDGARIALAKWIARYYIAPIFDAIALMLPPGFQRRPTTLVRATAGESAAIDLPPRQRETLDSLLAGGPASIEELRERVGSATVDAAVAQLERRGLVEREYALARPRIGPRIVEVATLVVGRERAAQIVAEREPPKHSRRAAALAALADGGSLPVREATRFAGSAANLARLTRDGSVRIEDGVVKLAVAREEAERRAAEMRRNRRAAQALAAIDLLATSGEATLAALTAAGVEGQTVRWLREAGVVTVEPRAIERDPLAGLHVVRRAPPELLPAQQKAADAIAGAIDSGRAEMFLLHGVTGSGKTEVYLAALDRCIAAGRRAIVMVPEIALTPQTVRRFHERVERVAVLHSGLSDGERFDQWHGIAAGRYDVVIGSRSAVFAPQPGLGLIIVDEEHEWTYKQHDASPRYHARDAALELAQRTGVVTVLGSATPDVCSYERAMRGAYHLLELPERIRPVVDAAGATRLVASAAMPEVSVVDLREELHAGNRSMLSRALQEGIRDTLAADEQVILFLNRRGLASHVQCRDCGYVPLCSSCDVALAYHRQYDRLVCHQCNRQQRLPATCRQCRSPRVRLLGAGVERVEAEVARAFPHARVLRWDRDATRRRGDHERILAAFLAREADLLIGTQMVAKGLDLPGVTLVGVVSADVGLHLPDLRAGERVFQLMTQVAGRAGRGERPGRVIIQTYTPDHYAVEAAGRYDYEGFAEAELAWRQRAGYPPFGRMVRLLFAHANPRYAREEALRLQRALAVRRAELGADTQVVGPSPAYVPRLRGRWRWQIVLRGRDPASLVRDFVLPPDWTVDVDPISVT